MAEPKRLSIEAIKGKDLREVHEVDWPGTAAKVGVMELRCSELLEAYFEARELFAKRGWDSIDSAGDETFQAELELQYCFRMLVDPEAKLAKFRVFSSTKEARERLSPDERAYFAALHAVFQREATAAWKKNEPVPQAEETKGE